MASTPMVFCCWFECYRGGFVVKVDVAGMLLQKTCAQNDVPLDTWVDLECSTGDPQV